MSTPLSEQAIEQIRRQINRLFDEVAQLAEQDLEPPRFYAEFLQRVLGGVAAPGGAIWVRTAQGHLQLQYHVNLQNIGLDKSDQARQRHDDLLRQTCLEGKPKCLPPNSGGDGTMGNPTNFIILLAPMLVDGKVVGLVEVWQDARHSNDALPGFLQFVSRMASLASTYVRNLQLRQMLGQQEVTKQLENFSRQVHASLNPTEVAYLVANEGRRLIDCDRVSVAVRVGRKTTIEAISGADVVEKRSNLVQLQAGLAEKVAKWGEKLQYQGTKDDSLPPDVLDALDAYLAESNSKLLVVQPLKDEREKDSHRPARSTLIMESFEPPPAPEQLMARMEVVGRTACSALFNSVEHKRIPMRWIWLPLAEIQEGLGGKTRAIVAGVVAGVILLFLISILVPYPLKMDAKGQLLPEERRWMFTPWEAQVVQFPEYVETGKPVLKGQDLVLMRDTKLETKLNDLKSEIQGLEAAIKDLANRFSTASPQEKYSISAEQAQKQVQLKHKQTELESTMERIDAVGSRPGYFWLRAPVNGIILNADFRENLTNRYIKPSEPLLRIGDKDSRWEIELRIQQKHIGQVLQAFKTNNPDEELDVDILLLSSPTHTYKGKLARSKVAAEANPNREDPNEADPVVIAWVRIDGDDIPADLRVPHGLLMTGTEVHAKVRCGNHPMAYSLFYGVWEFFYEKVLFWF